MNKLCVELYGTILGALTQKGKGYEFNTCSDVFNKYQVASTIMSLAVPLLIKYTGVQKRRSENFFSELLPEGRNYEWLLESLPYSERNPYGMLRKYGKDVAGALTIYDPDDPGAHKAASRELVGAKEIRYLLEHMPQSALANSPVTGKTSLGGVQGKILLAKEGDCWYRVHNGYQSTHIIKPVVQEHPTMIYDEAFCMQLAYASGLTMYPVQIECFDGMDALAVERYDRSENNEWYRVHQEDFSQVLGAAGSEKYQEYGGKVSARRIAHIISRFCEAGDVEKFASQLIFSVAIGNFDMHAKNISILHMPDERISLAPTYDQVPLRHHNTDGKMALAVDGEYYHANLSIKNIVSELVSWRNCRFANEAEALIFTRNCLERYKSVLDDTTLSNKAFPSLVKQIHAFISNLLDGRSTGRIVT